MTKRSKYTLQQLLDEVKQTTPSFYEGQIFETLASSRKAKENFIKEGSPVKDFFKNTTKGDFLRVVETDGKVAKCINLSLKEDIREDYYSNDEDNIILDYFMIANGTVKHFKRKNVDKYFIEQ